MREQNNRNRRRRISASINKGELEEQINILISVNSSSLLLIFGLNLQGNFIGTEIFCTTGAQEIITGGGWELAPLRVGIELRQRNSTADRHFSPTWSTRAHLLPLDTSGWQLVGLAQVSSSVFDVVQLILLVFFFFDSLTLLQRKGGTGRRHYLFVLGTESRHQTGQHLAPSGGVWARRRRLIARP